MAMSIKSKAYPIFFNQHIFTNKRICKNVWDFLKIFSWLGCTSFRTRFRISPMGQCVIPRKYQAETWDFHGHTLEFAWQSPCIWLLWVRSQCWICAERVLRQTETLSIWLTVVRPRSSRWTGPHAPAEMGDNIFITWKDYNYCPFHSGIVAKDHFFVWC